MPDPPETDILAVRHKAPIKYCLHCGKRNHAHSKKCNTCGEALPCKEKPAKRKHESLSMKHYEDSILDKVRAVVHSLEARFFIIGFHRSAR